MPLDGSNIDIISGAILETISYLERYGWCKGKAVDGVKRCLFGAVREVARGDTNLALGVFSRIENKNNIKHGMLTRYNDEHTKEEVLGILYKSV